MLTYKEVTSVISFIIQNDEKEGEVSAAQTR